MRLGREQLEFVKKKFNVDRLWSYSRLSTFVERPWDYRMTYLEKDRIRTDNIYTYFGTICHDIVQDCQDGKFPREKMIERFEDALIQWRLHDTQYKFMSEKVERNYIDNLSDYFRNSPLIPYQVENEKPVCVNFQKEDKKNLTFIGYIDSIFTDGEKWYIMDYKTSSKGDYTGAKLKAHSRQLLLYAIGIHQVKGIPYEDIICRFDMMKYYKVAYLQKNGKWKESIQERSTWVSSQEKKIRGLLSENDLSVFEIDALVGESNVANNLDAMPEYVKERFKISNCYIDVPVEEEAVTKLESFIIESVSECERKEAGDWEEEFPEPVIDEGNKFYYTVLAPQLLKVHKGYQEGLKYQGGNKTDEQIDDIASLFD